jgi:ribonuclease BN (tRNA processing enzyme)
VLGGCGAWPAAGQACSGYLLEQDGFRLLIDPGYAVVPRLAGDATPTAIDAVFVTHGHPDHCADLNPLLRARAMSGDQPPALPVFAPAHALDAVLALDRPGMLDATIDRRDYAPGDRFDIGPFGAQTTLLPHSIPNGGVRLTAGGHTVAYTGDTGPSPEIVTLARDADLLLAEASYVDEEMPDDLRPVLSTAREAGQYAAAAAVGRLLLTHLIPGTDADRAVDAARANYPGHTSVVSEGLTIQVA